MVSGMWSATQMNKKLASRLIPDLQFDLFPKIFKNLRDLCVSLFRRATLSH